ncbi:MAG: hypothetical protein NT038_06080 [Euryarchaeota archaeon]|nr:hypothetical protein [Euryarchaeota archaeon]
MDKAKIGYLLIITGIIIAIGAPVIITTSVYVGFIRNTSLANITYSIFFVLGIIISLVGGKIRYDTVKIGSKMNTNLIGIGIVLIFISLILFSSDLIIQVLRTLIMMGGLVCIIIGSSAKKTTKIIVTIIVIGFFAYMWVSLSLVLLQDHSFNNFEDNVIEEPAYLTIDITYNCTDDQAIVMGFSIYQIKLNYNNIYFAFVNSTGRSEKYYVQKNMSISKDKSDINTNEIKIGDKIIGFKENTVYYIQSVRTDTCWGTVYSNC